MTKDIKAAGDKKLIPVIVTGNHRYTDKSRPLERRYGDKEATKALLAKTSVEYSLRSAEVSLAEVYYSIR